MASPQAWKSRLLPIYNASVHGSRRAARILEALLRGQIAHCHVCGRLGPHVLRRGVLAPELARRWELPPRLVCAFTRKESLDCAWCGASLRVRRLASVILERFPAGRSKSIAQWVNQREIQDLRIAEINGIAGLTKWLQTLPNHRYSEYQPEPSKRIPHEDLTKLTYGDQSFDLVLTSETLEHVPDLPKALGEIHRVLIPGGRHLFTIPWRPDVPRTYARATLNDGQFTPTSTVIHHPGGDHGYPVFTEMGLDFPDRLHDAGFDVEVRFGPVSMDDVAQVCVTTRHVGP